MGKHLEKTLVLLDYTLNSRTSLPETSMDNGRYFLSFNESRALLKEPQMFGVEILFVALLVLMTAVVSSTLSVPEYNVDLRAIYQPI